MFQYWMHLTITGTMLVFRGMLSACVMVGELVIKECEFLRRVTLFESSEIRKRRPKYLRAKKSKRAKKYIDGIEQESGKGFGGHCKQNLSSLKVTKCVLKTAIAAGSGDSCFFGSIYKRTFYVAHHRNPSAMMKFSI